MTENGLFLYDSNAPHNTLVFTSKKRGYHGSFLYDSFDLGILSNGDSETAYRNLDFIKNLHGIKHVAFLKQIHGSQIMEAGVNGGFDFAEGDGLMTDKTGLALGIFTADCYPVIIFGKRHIAALHCGRKGLYAGIIDRAVREFEKRDDFPFDVYVGPGICRECYEVCEDALPPDPYLSEDTAEKNKNGRFRLNLRKIIENSLKIHKITNCRFSGVCTCCSSELYSYRREGQKTGRMLTIAMLREKYD